MAGAVVVPVNTRFSESEVAYVVDRLGGGASSSQPDAPLPDGEPYVTDDAEHDDLAAICVHERHDRLPKGRDGHPRELSVEHRDLRSRHADVAADDPTCAT